MSHTIENVGYEKTIGWCLVINSVLQIGKSFDRSIHREWIIAGKGIKIKLVKQ